MMTTNLFAIANVKQLRTYIVLELYCLFFFEHLGVLASQIQQFFLTVFTVGLSLARFFGGPSEFRGGGVRKPETPPPGYATVIL
jgi:hypothetical protein